MNDENAVVVRSNFGDMQVVVFMPGQYTQAAYCFLPTADPQGLKNVSRRDLMIVRAMLQDALGDIDDEQKRRWAEEPAFPYPSPRPVTW